MKWRPGDCAPGDVIRVHLGGICHYGIYAADDEVIQFGLPPLPEYRDRPDAFLVTATDISLFSCGQIVEIGIPEKEERRQRFSPQETLRRARARMGEAGYDLLRNNCEHFVWECAYGQKRCVQADQARQRWLNRPVLDVYLAPIPEDGEAQDPISPERKKELDETRNPKLRLQRATAWKALEYAADRSFGLRAEELRFSKNVYGRWSCEGMEFSLSHTDGMAAAAVSGSPVGVDLESIPAFRRQYADRPDRADAVLRRIRARGEDEAHGAAALLYTWTGKESLFKARQTGLFLPHRLSCGGETRRFVLELETPVMIAVSGAHPEKLRFFLYQNGTARRLDPGLVSEGKEGLCKYFG